LSSVKPELDVKEWSVKVKGELTTSNLGKVQVIASDVAAVDGTKIDVSLKQTTNKDQDAVNTDLEFKTTYNYDKKVYLRVGGFYQFEKITPPKATGHFIFQYPENLYWSFSPQCCTYQEEKQTLYDLNLDGKVSYIQPSYEALINVVSQGKKNKKTFTINWFHNLTERVNYGVQLSSNFGTKGHEDTNVDVAGEYKVDEQTSLKGKITSSVQQQGKDQPTLRLATSVVQKMNKSFTLTVGADLNARHLVNASEGAPHSFGFEIKLVE